MTIDIIDYCCFSYDAMLISVDVHLLRGKKKPLNVEADALVETLKHCAQSALGTGRRRPLNSSGEVLDGAETITEANLILGRYNKDPTI